MNECSVRQIRPSLHPSLHVSPTESPATGITYEYQNCGTQIIFCDVGHQSLRRGAGIRQTVFRARSLRALARKTVCRIRTARSLRARQNRLQLQLSLPRVPCRRGFVVFRALRGSEYVRMGPSSFNTGPRIRCVCTKKTIAHRRGRDNAFDGIPYRRPKFRDNFLGSPLRMR